MKLARGKDSCGGLHGIHHLKGLGQVGLPSRDG